MKLARFIHKLGLGLSACCFFTLVQAAPLLTFTADANFPPQMLITAERTAVVKYVVTNQSRRAHTFVMNSIPGINPVTSGAGNCASAFRLGYKEYCTLTLIVNGSALVGNVSGGPVVCSNGSGLQCYQPSEKDILNIVIGAATIFYVNGNKSINGNGSSWNNAFNNLESALEAAATTPGLIEIWVAEGVYKPSQVYAPHGVVGGAYGINTSKLITFNLPSNTAIYGGFLGTETNRDQRNGQLHPTILCGDMTSSCLDPYTPSGSNNRVWHVLMAGSDVSPGVGVKNVKLDSLIIRGGYADGPDNGVLGAHNALVSLSYEHAAGGGLLARYGSTIAISQTVFEQNTSDGLNALVSEVLNGEFLVLASGGGAIAAIDTDTLITIDTSRFTNNSAIFPGGSGGALENLIDASYIISSSQFDQNIAFRNGGGLRSKDGGDVIISLSTFNNNAINGPVPDASGGALGIINTNLSVSNSNFTQNSTTLTGFGGGAIFFHTPFDDGTPYFLNISNATFTSNVGAAFGGGGVNVFGILPNTGTQATITNSSFISNTGGVGGAVYLDSIPTSITSSTFTSNSAQLEGGAIFASNYGNAVFASPLRPIAQISSSNFNNNTIAGVPSGTTSPLVFFNSVAIFFSGGSSTVTTMAPGGGAIAVEFSGNAQIFNNTFTGNTALSIPPAEEDRGGAILVGGSAGTPTAMDLAQAIVSANTFSNNQANIDNNLSIYNPANIPGGP